MTDASTARVEAIWTQLEESRPGPWCTMPGVDPSHLHIYTEFGDPIALWFPTATHDPQADLEFVLHAHADLAWGCTVLDRTTRGPLALTDAERMRLRAVTERVQRLTGDRWYADYEDDDYLYDAMNLFAVSDATGMPDIARWEPLDTAVPSYTSDTAQDPHLNLVLAASRDLPWLCAQITAALTGGAGMSASRPHTSVRAALFSP